jgi:hypothetical protein
LLLDVYFEFNPTPDELVLGQAGVGHDMVCGTQARQLFQRHHEVNVMTRLSRATCTRTVDCVEVYGDATDQDVLWGSVASRETSASSFWNPPLMVSAS